MGRVARRIWAVAMRDRYGANERSQKLKYHVADLRAQRCMRRRSQFNDIRTTLQALIAIYDNCNSLHTNAFDEAITTPTEDIGAPRDGDPADHQPRVGPGEEREPEPGRVHHRRADRAGRGGGARRSSRRSPSAAACSARWRPATSAARSRKSRMHYEMLKHTGEYPIVGVNTFRNPHGDAGRRSTIELARSTEDEKQSPAAAARATSTRATRTRRRRCCERLQQAVIDNGNVFEVLMDAVRVLLARADHRRAVRGRRAVPAQHVRPADPARALSALSLRSPRRPARPRVRGDRPRPVRRR